MKISDLYSEEGIDYMFNSKLGSGIEAELQKVRQLIQPKSSDIKATDLDKIIKQYTGITTNVSTDWGYTAYMYPADINRNNPILNKLNQMYASNLDSKEFIKDKGFVEGTVNLKTGMVYGDFSKVTINIFLGEDLLGKFSALTVPEVTAILLHEIGHAFVYFEMLARSIKTNYILSEGTKRLLTANTTEQRVLILSSVEQMTKTSIDNKDKIASKKRNEAYYTTILLSASINESIQDLGVNIYSTRSFEQLSDNFATRHGYGRALVLGLSKLHRLYGGNETIPPVVYNTISVILAAIVIFNPAVWLLLTFVLICEGNPLKVTYDPLKKRILKIKQQINDALKDKSLSKEYKQVFLNDYVEIQKVFDEIYLNSDLFEVVWKYLTPWGYKQNKQIKHNEELESLLNNDLFTATAKLQIS
jgi:hypothetical protein